MGNCKKECICLKCKSHLTEACKYSDCKWCKGKDGITRCKDFIEENKEVREQ
jgi:hypothetical protein